MLKKKFCKECRERFELWNKYDDIWWKKDREICCPSIYIGKGEDRFRKITEQPPTKCPYYLENIL